MVIEIVQTSEDRAVTTFAPKASPPGLSNSEATHVGDSDNSTLLVSRTFRPTLRAHTTGHSKQDSPFGWSVLGVLLLFL